MQHSPASALLFPSILDAGVKVLLFAGDEDLICNYVGVERTAERIVWNGGEKRGLKNATEEEWVVNGTLAGSWKKAGGLEYVRVSVCMPVLPPPISLLFGLRNKQYGTVPADILPFPLLRSSAVPT